MSETKLRAPEDLSDDELTTELQRLAAAERNATVALIAHLAEFDLRRLYRSAGFSSLFGYCAGALRFSEASAYHRIKAARAARKFPVILELLANGVVNLTSVRLLAPHLTRENHGSLLGEAAGKSRLEVEELLARRFPRQAVPDSVRKLPAPTIATAVAPSLDSVASHQDASSETVSPLLSASPALIADRPSLVAATMSLAASSPPARPPVVAPLSSDRYKITFTATAETFRRLRQAQELLRHQMPQGDLADVVDRALSALIEQLTRSKFAAVTRPRRSRTREAAPPTSGRHIPAEVRRAVWQRDHGSCAFVSADGRRCGERGFVEFHHLRPFAVDGPATTANIALRCRSHNGYEAELYFGASRRFAAAAQPP